MVSEFPWSLQAVGNNPFMCCRRAKKAFYIAPLHGDKAKFDAESILSQLWVVLPPSWMSRYKHSFPASLRFYGNTLNAWCPKRSSSEQTALILSLLLLCHTRLCLANTCCRRWRRSKFFIFSTWSLWHFQSTANAGDHCPHRFTLSLWLGLDQLPALRWHWRTRRWVL